MVFVQQLFGSWELLQRSNVFPLPSSSSPPAAMANMCLKNQLSVFVLTLMVSVSIAQLSPGPWEVTRLVTSGLPYRSEAACHDPLNTIAVEIRDTNSYPGSNTTEPQSTQCIAKFPYCSPPYHKSFNCTEVPYGSWSFTFFPTDDHQDAKYWNPGQNFTLWFRLLIPERGVWYDGLAAFSVGGNLRGMCSAGGICSFALKEELTPVYVNQTGAM
jgi:hypothetical protein